MSWLLKTVAAAAKSLQSCPTLCNSIDSSPPGSPVPGILQARTLEWVAISFSNAWKWKVKVNSLSRVQTLSDPMDCSLPGSSIHGIFQARVLEWGAIAFSLKTVKPAIKPCWPSKPKTPKACLPNARPSDWGAWHGLRTLTPVRELLQYNYSSVCGSVTMGLG